MPDETPEQRLERIRQRIGEGSRSKVEAGDTAAPEIALPQKESAASPSIVADDPFESMSEATTNPPGSGILLPLVKLNGKLGRYVISGFSCQEIWQDGHLMDRLRQGKAELCHKLGGVGDSTLDRLEEAGAIPPPRRLTPGERNFWDEADIDASIDRNLRPPPDADEAPPPVLKRQRDLRQYKNLHQKSW